MIRILVTSFSMLVAAVTSIESAAYDLLSPVSVRNNTHSWFVHLPGDAGDGTTFVGLFRAATHGWMAVAPQVELGFVEEEREFCNGETSINGVNTVAWQKGLCDGSGPIGGGWAPWKPNYVVRGSELYVPGGDVAAIAEGDIAFRDNFENWARDPLQFLSTALHEIGHNLGLGHSVVFGANMNQGSYSEEWADQISPDDLCGLAIVTGYRERCPIALGEPLALSGDSNLAHFSGFASSNAGRTDQEVFRPWEEVDVYATALVDPRHWGQAGALHVVVEMESGEYLTLSEEAGLIPFSTLPLPAAKRIEAMDFAEDLVVVGRNGVYEEWPDFPYRIHPVSGEFIYPSGIYGENYGLEGQTVKFWIAYSVESEPEEVIYGSSPIVVQWTQE